MSIQAEAIEAVENLHRRAMTAEVRPSPSGVDGELMVIKPGGGVEFLQSKPKWRRYAATDLTGLGQLIDFAAEREGTKPVAFVGEGGVFVAFDESTRLEHATLPLPVSKQLQRLRAWEATRTAIGQAEMVLLLRSELHDTFTPSGLLPILRSLKFSSNADGEANLQHGRESMGMAINRKVAGGDADELPETVTFRVPVFDVPDCLEWFDDGEGNAAVVECALHIDLESHKFALIPLPGLISRAMRQAEAQIAKWLRDESKAAAVFECASVK